MTAVPRSKRAPLLNVEHEIRARALEIAIATGLRGQPDVYIVFAEAFATYIRSGIVASQETGTT